MKMKKPHERKQHSERKKANNSAHQKLKQKEELSQEKQTFVLAKNRLQIVKNKLSEYIKKIKEVTIEKIDIKNLNIKNLNIKNLNIKNLNIKNLNIKKFTINKIDIKMFNLQERFHFNRLKQAVIPINFKAKVDFATILRSKAFILSCVFLVAVIATYGIGQQVKQAQMEQQQQFLEDNKTFKVFVDGDYIGNLSDTQIMENHINRQLTQMINLWDLEARLKNVVTYEDCYDMEIEAQDAYVLEEAKQLLDFQTRSVMMYVNDMPVVRVENVQVAEEIIENVKRAYVSDSENSKVTMVEITDRVDYKIEWAKADEIVGLDSATAILLRGTDKEIKHIVESGENIGVIARKNKVTVSEIVEANQFKSQNDIIRPGDELSMVVPEPFVHVEVVEEITEIESIPFSTRNVNNNSMYTWESKVETRGQSGEREVVYKITKLNGKEIEKEIIAETILKEPVEQVVSKGTIGVPSNGSGTLAWPTSSGRVTSMFGGARRHSGVDIGNPTGTVVYAADNGTVVFAGWNGGYGNLVRISHTSTMETYYAHLNSINVRVGQTVKKGEVIGRVGSTGNSTGPHLHFEVRLNGSPVNPMNYYGSTR